MKIVKTAVLLFSVMALFVSVSCNKENDDEKVKSDAFEYRGKYVWEFMLDKGKQVSTHTFFAEKIDYQMEGKTYSTKYTMKKISYDKKMNKWIGKDEAGNVYVLFFKNKTENAVTIYKHKCKEGGLEEANNFKMPPANSENDHGWNEYTKQ